MHNREDDPRIGFASYTELQMTQLQVAGLAIILTNMLDIIARNSHKLGPFPNLALSFVAAVCMRLLYKKYHNDFGASDYHQLHHSNHTLLLFPNREALRKSFIFNFMNWSIMMLCVMQTLEQEMRRRHGVSHKPIIEVLAIAGLLITAREFFFNTLPKDYGAKANTPAMRR